MDINTRRPHDEKRNLEAFRKKFEEVVSASLTDEMLTPVVDIDLVVPSMP
ncbi:MAG: hypothetical protein WDO15_12255 [Bacteroidota bacterium]